MTMTEEELEKNLGDPIWRISNLYQIRTEKGKVIPFRPNRVQKRILEEIFIFNHTSILAPKSRRHGISTLITIVLTDQAAFTPGINVAIVDKTQGDAIKKLDIAQRAINSLIKKLPNTWEVVKVKECITLTMKGREKSAIHGGKTYRGSDLMSALISELGTIAADEPKRSTEIIDSTLPAARFGLRVIETTVKGGKKGAFWEMVQEAVNLPEEEKTNKDWRVLFFPWWEDPNNTETKRTALQTSTNAYFTQLRSKEGIVCTEGQMLWWQRIKRDHVRRMNQEFPSTLEEAFEVPLEGTILEGCLEAAHADGRITVVPYDRSQPCMAFWDLGAPLNTVSTVLQIIDSRIHILEMDCGRDGEEPGQRVSRVLAKFPTLNTNYLPHDAAYGTAMGISQIEIWQRAGLPGIVSLPKTPDKWIGINHLLSLFSRFYFDKDATASGRAQLLSYRTAGESKGGGFKNDIVHDYSSHWADSLRMVAEAELNKMIRTYTMGRPVNEIHVSFGNLFKGRNYIKR